MRIFRYLMEHKAAVLVVVLCFVIQAYCDLSLPNYTSNIVDVGIQQSGVEHASPEVLTESSHDAIEVLAQEQDAQLIDESYAKTADGYYELTDYGKENRDALDEAISAPLVINYYANQSSEIDFDAIISAYKQGKISSVEIQELVDQAQSSLGDVDESVLSQQAINAAKAEYDACNVSLDDMQLNYLLRIGLAMLAMVLFSALIHCVMNFFACRTSMKIGRDLRNRFFNKVVSFSAAEIDQFSAASLITRGTNDIQQIQMLCLMAQRMMIYTPILAIGGIIMVVQTNVSMSWIIVLAVVVVFVAMIALFALTMPKFKIMQTLIDKVNLVAREILSGLPVVRAYNREGFEENRFKQANENLMKTQLFTNRAMSFMMPIMMLVMNATSALIIWVGGHYVDYGTVQTGDLIAFITYAITIVSSFLAIGMIAIILPRANVAAQRVDEVINTSTSINDAMRVYDCDLPKTPGAKIEFRDVSFRYSEDSENALDNISFTIEPGQTFAIIGATGCGKSSVIKLIERFYDVTEGEILIDGIDIRNLSQKALRAQLGYVPQASFLFSGTIESNVLYGAEDAPTGTAENAIEIAQAADFVSEKEHGIASEISQGGTNVSGGQRQRLAIARAIATDARAYLFDDSFSALDYKTDAKLRHDLKARLAGRTIVIVAQRISTIMDADTILVLEDGKQVGIGTHEQLLQTCEAYKEIAYSQLSEEELLGGGERNE